jgi:site-specific recombinase XerC
MISGQVGLGRRR